MNKRSLVVAALVVITCCHEKVVPPNLAAAPGAAVGRAVRGVVNLDAMAPYVRDAGRAMLRWILPR